LSPTAADARSRWAPGTLRAILDETGAGPIGDLGFLILADLVIERGALLDGPQRTRVRTAFRDAGYSFTPPADIVGALLGGLTSTIIVAVPVPDPDPNE
jgi:hypothetical protein